VDDLLIRLRESLADRYALERELGRGGMATVYLARDLKHDRSVAIKVLDPRLAAGLGPEAFLQEMQVTARLQHPLILPLHDSGSVQDLLYYVMPFVEGETLRDRLRRDGQLPIEDATRIAREVADALAYAHEKGIVHRDIKPENILLTGGHAVVADFGIARAIQMAGDRTVRMGERVSGTPAYMSPEQAMGEPGDGRTDVYSLGCVLYEMLAGSPPFVEPSTQALLHRVLVETPVPVENHRTAVPEALASAVAKSLEKLPADRWTTAGQFTAALAAVDTERRTTVETRVVPESFSGAFGVRLLGVVVGFALVSALLLIAAYVLVQKFGLPDWVMPATIALLAIGLPILLAAAFFQKGGRGPHRWLNWRTAIAGGAIAFFALAVVVSGYMISRKTGIGPGASLVSAGVLQKRDRILIADFKNATPDSLLGQTLQEALSVDLTQSPSVTVVPTSQIAQALLRMQRDPRTPLGQDLARELAIREGIKGILVGDLAPLGSGYVLSAKLLSAETGDVLVAHREGADGPEELIGAVDRLSKKLRERIGESLKSIRANKPLEQVTTRSLDALQKYSQAVHATETEGNDDKAIALLGEAVSLDSTFAMAYRKLATILDNTNRDPAQVYRATTRAFELRERLPDRERYLTEGSYYRLINAYDQAAVAYQKILDENPNDTWALNNSGVVSDQLGDPERALEFFRRAETVSPSPLTLGNMINEEVRLGRYGDAEKSLEEFAAKYPDNPQTWEKRFFLNAAQGQYDVAESTSLATLKETKQHVFLQGQILGSLNRVMAVQGKLAASDGWSRRQSALFEQGGFISGYYRSIGAVAEETLFLCNDPARAREVVEAALAKVPLSTVSPEERPYPELAMFYAMAGDVARARSLLSDYERTVDPLIRKTQENRIHGSLGAIALAERRPAEAIREFQIDRAKRADQPILDLPLIARAYEMAGVPDSALVSYERYVTTPDLYRLRDDSLFLPGSLIRLGELYEERGDRNRAIEYYSRFVELWKEADPELQGRVRTVQGRLDRLLAENKG
jgi:eukaryotic-like serine/threonine-protein kinase